MNKLVVFSLLTIGLKVGWAIPLYEPFNYDPTSPTTNLIGRTNLDGLTWLQAGPDSGLTNQPGVVAGNLQYPGKPPAKGNSARLGGNGTTARFSFRDIDAVNNGTIYFSFVFRLSDTNAMTTSGVFWAGFNNTQGSQTTTPSSVATRLVTKLDTNNPGYYVIGLDKTSGQVGQFQFAPTLFTTNDVIFVVASYTYNPSVGDDEARMWINPDPLAFGTDTPPTPTLISLAGNDFGNIRSFCLFNRRVDQPREVLVDELLIGTTWADVTPGTNDMLAIPPKNQRVLAGVDVYFDTRAALTDSYQWQSNGVAIAGATSTFIIISNVQPADAGTYSVVYSNLAGRVTNSATLTVESPDIYPRLSPLWNIAPGSRPYVTTASSGAPNQRSLAYSAASNQVYVLSVTGAVPAIHVLNATNGSDLYQLNADTNIINGGNLVLASIEAGDDGSLYACNMTVNAAGANGYRLYRWANADSSTTPSLVYGPAEPASQTASYRYGDTLALRGSGEGTRVLIDEESGVFGSVLTPTDGSLSSFISSPFFQNYGRGTIGRSLQFGAGDSMWQKARSVQYGDGGPFRRSDYDTNGVLVSTTLTNIEDFPSIIGPVALDTTQNLLVGLNFSPIPGLPDSVALYEVSDVSRPLLLSRYNFPVDQQGNANSIGKLIISGDKVFALNGNNGVLAFRIAAFAPALSIERSGDDVLISWTTNAVGYTLRTTQSLSPTITWMDIGPGTIVGGSYVVTNDSSGTRFFQLRK